MGWLLAWLRALVVLVGTPWLVLEMQVRKAFSAAPVGHWQATYRRRWARFTLHTLGLKLTVRGSLPQGRALVVSNHRSYMDAPALLGALPCTMLSKQEVAEMPAIGMGAKVVGILFVRRDNARSRAASLIAIRKAIESGTSVVLFPEGTTQSGPGLGEFQLGAFQLAETLKVPIMPVALRYANPADVWGNESLRHHFIRTFGKLRGQLTISLGPLYTPKEAVLLRNEAREWIAAELEKLDQA